MLILAKIIGVSTISPRPVLEIFQGSVMYTYLCTVLSDNVPLLKKKCPLERSLDKVNVTCQEIGFVQLHCPWGFPQECVSQAQCLIDILSFSFFFLTFFLSCPPTTTSHVFFGITFQSNISYFPACLGTWHIFLRTVICLTLWRVLESSWCTCQCPLIWDF